MSRVLEKFVVFIYNLIFIGGFIIYLPLALWRKKINFLALRQKLGGIPKLNIKDAIWIQAVSVGEANLIENLIRRLKEIYDYPIVISTTTLTGNKIANQKYASVADVIFFPFDLSFVINKIIKLIKPKIFIAVETEIWPNLFHHLNKRNIPMLIINARISDKAFSRYKLIRPLIKGFMNKCEYIGVQNEAYRQRFISLGAGIDKVIVSQNMKFESIAPDEEQLLKTKNTYLPALKENNRFILIAASTHSPEEEIFIDIYQDIVSQAPATTLVIAPRHPQRCGAVENLIRAKGFNPVRISEFFSCQHTDNSVFILDTVGKLLYFYSIADICFVGGSLSGNGGHNILEPIYFLKPTLFGPAMDNFRDIEKTVLEKGAGLRVKNPAELKLSLLKLIKNEALRSDLRNRCLEVFESQKGSIDRNLELIVKCINQK